MKDTLPLKIQKNETGIVNLDSIRGPGTHWVCSVSYTHLDVYKRQVLLVRRFDPSYNQIIVFFLHFY